jgi:hypothetical protein
MTTETKKPKVITEKYSSEAEWVAAAKSLRPDGGRMQTNRGYGGGLAPSYQSITVYDVNGAEVAQVRWDRT